MCERNYFKNMLYMFEFTFFKSLTSFSSTSVTVFTISVASQLKCLNNFHLHSHMHSSQCLLIFPPTKYHSGCPSVVSDMQHFINPLTIISGEVCCQSLDLLTQQFPPGLFYSASWYQNMVPCQESFRIFSISEMFIFYNI